MPSLPRQIAQLEAHIEELSGAAERCRTIMLAARIAAGAGGLLLIADMLGLLRLQPAMFLASIAAILAGIVVYGSNRTTLNEIEATIRDRERRRDQLINGLGLQVAGGAADRPVIPRASPERKGSQSPATDT